MNSDPSQPISDGAPNPDECKVLADVGNFYYDEVRGVSIWQAGRADVIAYHKARRRGGVPARVSAQTWNRAVAALDKLFECLGWPKVMLDCGLA